MAWLEQELERESRRDNVEQGERIAWVADHLDEYIDRWLGFVEVPNLAMESLVSGKLWDTIGIGAELLTRELHRASASENVLREWNAFLCTLVEVGSGHEKEPARQLLEHFRAVRSLLQS